MKIRIALSLAVLLVCHAGMALSQQNAGSADKVYRWVDEEGNVHYTATLPPDFKDKKADVLDDQGITREKDISLVPPPPKPVTEIKAGKDELPRDKSGLQRPDPLYNDAEMQKQKDALLVLRYHSEEEILDALGVEVRQLAYDTDLLTKSRTSLDASYAGNVRELADRQRAGVAIPPEELKAIENLKRRMALNEKDMREIQVREQATQKKFADDLERYRYLTSLSESAQP
jgi:hypothetical protein